jgi:hypothetical protein
MSHPRPSEPILVALLSCVAIVFPATIAGVQKSNQRDATDAGNRPFRAGTMTVVTLANPREKFWGILLALTAEGLTLCGIELASFEDLISMVKDGEPFTPSVVFFPMHRVERMELDLPDGSIPSLSQRFTAKTSLIPSDVLSQHASGVRAREEPA